MSKNVNVGGQAVIEGVMMRGKMGIATAVRTTEGEIVVEKKGFISYTKKNKFLGLPIIRGFISLIESLVIGVQTLNYSASFFEEEGEASKLDKWIEKIFKDKSNDVIMGISLVISLVVSVGLFFILPTLVASVFSKMGASTMGLNIVEGIIRVLIFLLYVYLIGKMEDIKRVYQYHGAEHKTIFCYENNVELTPENASKFGRLHPRCGTNFLFLVMIVSIVVFSLTGWNSLGERIIYRIVLLPLISGVSYEIIKWMGKSEGTLAKILSYPGLKLQNLTTREPDLSQIEVAIRALKEAEGIMD
ncbi:MAG TPA: DUF1385 domain-containing protein [Clostridium sp.]|uniref:DUF1385 domain-containing protein n=1 Tax=Clostridium sp. TaxID=1506 RepID=UPI002F947FC5